MRERSMSPTSRKDIHVTADVTPATRLAPFVDGAAAAAPLCETNHYRFAFHLAAHVAPRLHVARCDVHLPEGERLQKVAP